MSRDFHPTGQVTINSSTIIDANNYKSGHDNAGQLKATLADPNGIPVVGMRAVNISFDLYITNEGMQAPVVSMCDNAEVCYVGYKFPVNGINEQAKGIFSKADIAQNLGDALIITCTFIGHTVDLSGGL